MSVLIKGIGMPRTHPITIEIYPNGTVLSKTVGRMNIHGKAVPVPPHGRLGDLDALHNAIAANIIGSRCGEETSVEIAINEAIIDDLIIIDAQQTIIPAEEGET